MPCWRLPHCCALWSKRSLRSCLASGARANVRLRADIRVGHVTATQPLVDFPIDLVPERRRQLNTLAAVELVEADLDLGAERVELTVALFEQAERFLDHFVGVAVGAGVDLLADAGLGLWGKTHAHRDLLLPLSLAETEGAWTGTHRSALVAHH